MGRLLKKPVIEVISPELCTNILGSSMDLKSMWKNSLLGWLSKVFEFWAMILHTFGVQVDVVGCGFRGC